VGEARTIAVDGVRRTGGDLVPRVTHDPNRLPAGWDVRDRLGTLDVPAPVIVGTYDFICSTRYAHELCAGLADEFTDAVVDFVTTTEKGRGR
jgi:proline iminopeptidase